MSISLRSGLAAAVLAAVLGFVSLAQAQYTVGRVEGTVSDASGAVVGGARVTLRSLATNLTRTYVTDHSGLFVFFALPPGRYELAAEAASFARRRVELTVLTNQTVTQHLTLAVPQETTTVEINEQQANLNPVESQQSVTRTEFEISRLSSLGHNMMSMVHLAPGVAPTNNPRGGTTFGGGGTYVITLGVQSGLIAANGGRARASSVQLDYTDANDWEGGGFAPGTQSITPDMLQEFKVLTTNFSAEYGLKSNAQVMMVTRSGSNNLHGAAYDLLQNDAFNARDYFDTTGDPTPLKQNIYGFTVGGPLLRDRTFFFTGYEGRRVRGGGFTALARVPSLSARARATDPAVIDLINRFLPAPTGATKDPDVGTVPVQVPSPIDTYQWVIKGDHHFSDRHSIAARYLQSTANFVARFSSLNSLRGFDVDNHFELRNLSLADTYVLSPRTVQELRFAYGHTSAQGRPQGGLDTPRFLISQVVNFGALQTVPSGRIFDVYQVNDQVSHVRGAHIFKFGGDIRSIGDESLNATNSRGVFTFTSVDKFVNGQPSLWTQLFGDTERDFRTAVYAAFFQDDWKLRSTLTLNLGFRWEMQGAQSETNGLSSVLDLRASGPIGAAGSGPLGAIRTGGDAVGGNPFNFGPRLGFAWNPRATNLVLRGGYGIYWDSFTFTALNSSRFTPPTNYTFNVPAARLTGANIFAHLLDGTAPLLAQAQSLIGNFGALKNFGSITTIDPRLRNPYVQQFSLGLDYQFKSYVASVGYVGTKGTHLTRLIPINPVVNGPAPAVSVADEAARLAAFSAAVSKENGNLNSLSNRLDPRFDQLSYHDDGGSSIYHALQLSLRKVMSHGLQMQASYTWSKSIDDASDYAPSIQANDNSYAQDGSNLAAERAVSNYDIPHRLAITGIWQLPFFKNQTGPLGKVLKGWSFESVNMWQSGIPATLLAGPRTLPVLDPVTHAPVLDPVTHLPTTATITDVNLDGNLIPTPNGSDNTRADCNPGGAGFIFGNPATIPDPKQRGVNGAPNSSDFRYTQPLLGHNGTCGRNTLRMNSLTNFDWSVFKDFILSEQGPLGSGPWNLQIRGELYNVFNTPFLTAQGDGWRTLSSGSFGTYNAAGATRRLQVALRLSW